MGSGVIYAMVVGLWALVLVPTWLRSHEQSDEGKQVDRFRRAMSQLQTSHVELLLQTQHKEIKAKRAARARTISASGEPVLSPAARRRRVLGALAALQVVGTAAMLFGVGAYAALVPAMLIGTFLTLARSQVRAEQARRAPAPARATAPSAPQGTFARTLAAARAARRASTARTPDVVEQTPAAPTVEAPSSWQPVRTPAPAYISAPAATAVPRAIDAAGGWTGDAMVAAAREAQADAVRAMAEEATPELITTTPAAFDVDVTAEIPVIRHTA